MDILLPRGSVRWPQVKIYMARTLVSPTKSDIPHLDPLATHHVALSHPSLWLGRLNTPASVWGLEQQLLPGGLSSVLLGLLSIFIK